MTLKLICRKHKMQIDGITCPKDARCNEFTEVDDATVEIVPSPVVEVQSVPQSTDIPQPQYPSELPFQEDTGLYTETSDNSGEFASVTEVPEVVIAVEEPKKKHKKKHEV